MARLLSNALRNRADRRCYQAAKPDMPDMRADHRILPSGLTHPDSGLAAGDLVEGYLSVNNLDEVIHDYLLREVDRDRANVILHVVPADARPHLLGDRAGQLLLPADLAEHDEPRELSRAVDLLRQVSVEQ